MSGPAAAPGDGPGRSGNARDAVARRHAAVALAAIGAYLAIAVGVQAWRSDQWDWWQAPLSFYLLGTSGLPLKAAYFGLATGLVALGLGGRAALGRGSPVAALFVLAGVALASVALLDTDLPGGTRTAIGEWHRIAAQTAFLSVNLAMLGQSLLLRGDAAWRARFAPAFALALLASAALVVHVAWRDAPRGLTQRVAIASVLAWGVVFAWWLRGAGRMAASAPRDGEGRARDENREKSASPHEPVARVERSETRG